MQLTDRQMRILRAVVEEYQQTARPVGSRTLVERSIIDASASTVRYELGRLEQAGLLEAPHTSAGRVPTDAGYRAYVDLVSGGAAPAGGGALTRPGAAELADGDSLGTQIDEALRATTQALAEMTQLLAVVTAPRASGAVIRHVEVLQLQSTMLVVVIITAAGDVTRQVVATGAPVDPGLVDWCGEYLNEQVTGMTIGQNLLRARLRPGPSAGLGPGERAMLALVEPAFSSLAGDAQDVHVGGSAELVEALGDDVQRVAGLVAILDERRRLLSALRPLVDAPGAGRPGRAGPSRVVVRIGAENELPELQRLSVVGAPYGRGPRPLGMVGVIGPRSMDYPTAMVAVHTFADALGHVADELYE